jgi:triosephosphate isomerase
MPEKKIYLYGNWKMNMTGGEAESFMKDFAAEFASCPALAAAGEKLETAVFPPFTSIFAAQKAAGGLDKKIAPFVGAQNAYFEPKGAFTGEVSVPMLKDAGCAHVILGHSERRVIFGETDEWIAKKVKAALNAGLVPVFCYGETLAEREKNETFDVVSRQLRAALSGLGVSEMDAIVYAYEPVWAIGTGKSATPAQAEEVCAYSKEQIRRFAASLSPAVLYGGSVNPDNARELLSMDAIDGALVGGASLKAASFLRIYKSYRELK